MRKAALCLFLALPVLAADYTITATLETRAHTVKGSELLLWRNDTAQPAAELRFHLYMNAFRDGDSTYMQESGESPEIKGSIQVQRLRISGGKDLTGAIRFIHPDDDNARDRTVIAIPLPEPVVPGASIALEIEFLTRLPRVSDRTGYSRDFYMIAQWFPKIGVWQQGQWNCHQFHQNSEFFSDFGRYDVTMTVPIGYKVGATGVEQSRVTHGATTTWRFLQDNVHDFAWTASPNYIRAERTLGATRAILLIQPEHAAQIDRHFRAVGTAMRYLGAWFGPYPYRTITIVDPPYRVRAGGMEYPTLITAGTSWLPGPPGEDPDDVTIHEFIHQYWYGMVASNEFEESWLDEGFTTYTTNRVIDLAYGPAPVTFSVLGIPLDRLFRMPSVSHDEASRAVYLLRAKNDNLLRNAWEYYDQTSYGVNSYPRSALTLRTLEHLVGERVMRRILRTYFERWRFRHPATRDFIHVANEVSGRDLNWFFDQFVYGSNVVDYGVGDVGEHDVAIRREGEAILPVDVRIRFENGRVENRTWDGRYRWVRYSFPNAAKIQAVEVDPGRKIPLDVNFANNTYQRSFATMPLIKWAGNLVFWFSNLLLAASSLV